MGDQDAGETVIDFTKPVGDRDAAIAHSSMLGFWIGFWLAGIAVWATDVAEPAGITSRVLVGLIVAVLSGRWGARHAHLWQYDEDAHYRWRRRDVLMVGLAGVALAAIYIYTETR